MVHVLLEGFGNGALLDTNVSFTSGGTPTVATGRDGIGIGLKGTVGANFCRLSFTSGSDQTYHHVGILSSDAAFGVNSIGYCYWQLLADAGTVAHLSITSDALGHLQLRRGSNTGTVIATSTNVLATGYYWFILEVRATIHDTTGECIVKVNGVEWINVSNVDTRNGGTSTRPDCIQLGIHNAPPVVLDDIIVNDTTGSVNNSWVGECTIAELHPIGNGANSGLLGSDGNSVNNYQQVDEFPYNTTDYNGSPTVGTKDTYDHTAVGKVGVVTGVKVSGYVQKSDSGAKTGRFIFRSGGGTEVESADIGLSTAWQIQSGAIRETDADATSWTVAKVDAHEFGFKVQA
jgi:hypothetical protein